MISSKFTHQGVNARISNLRPNVENGKWHWNGLLEFHLGGSVRVEPWEDTFSCNTQDEALAEAESRAKIKINAFFDS